MRKFRRTFDRWMSAITFAEANEADMALEFVGGPVKWKEKFSFDGIMAAITFAEAGEHATAREHLGVKPEPERAWGLDIPGVKIWYGSVALEPVPITGINIWIGTVTA